MRLATWYSNRDDLRDLARDLDNCLLTLSAEDIVSITHSESRKGFFSTRTYYTVLVVYVYRGQ